MSWLSIPLPNPFKSLQSSSDNDDDGGIQHSHQPSPRFDSMSNISPHDGAKGDFSAIGESITRQLRGVAAFLAPPPLAGDSNSGDVISGDKSTTLAGIRSDLAEIGGSLKNSLSVLSGNSTVAGISKLASNFLQLSDGDDDRDGGGHGDGEDEGDDVGEGAGITDEVVEFANRISNRTELWIDFPLRLDNKEVDLSDAQSEHASVMEQLVPGLADLRSRITGDMSDNHFWMIYFILLLPRLNDDDFELLSTPEIVEARELLLQMLQNKKGTEIDSENTQSPIVDINQSDRIVYENSAVSNSENKEPEDAKKPVKENAEKCVSGGTGTSITLCSEETADNTNIRTANEQHESDDNWSEGEKKGVTTRTFQGASKQFPSEDDVSFSDLEIEDDDNDLPSRQTGSGTEHATPPPSSLEGSSDWVQLNKNVANKGSQLRGRSSSQDRDSEGYESSDWLTVDDFNP